MRELLVAMIVLAGFSVWAEPTITGLTARQRYPWNGLVDIVVTIRGDTKDIANTECTFVTTNSAKQVAVPIVTIKQVGSDVITDNICNRHYLWDTTNDVGDMRIDDISLTVDLEQGVQLWENGPYWAKCNVGANQPEEYGYYFWWGDTIGYTNTSDGCHWISVDGSKVDFSFKSANCPTYGVETSTLEALGYVDSLSDLAAAHDAATTHLGTPWRMPTSSEISELVNNCTTKWTQCNGVNGKLVIGLGKYANKSIFLPAAGRVQDSTREHDGSHGFYWSASLKSGGLSSSAWDLYLKSDKFYRDYFQNFWGQTVRPLRGAASMVATASAGITVHFSLDLESGPRTTSKMEKLSFAADWESGSSDAVAEIAVDGRIVNSVSGSGVYEWTPPRNGTYVLTHTVLTNGVQVGETLTATFVATGFNPETPVISPASGTTFDSSLTVSMSCASEGATIHCTTDGSTPTMESPTYKKFRISGKTTVKAIAFFDDGTASEMAVAEYALGQCADPVIASAGGTTFAHSGNIVTITAAREGPGSTGEGGGYVADQVLRYTVDGTDPTADSPVYAGPLAIDETTVVKAKVFSDSFFDSNVVTANLTRVWENVATPVITAVDSFSGSRAKVKISCVTEGATVRYTLNGSVPTSHATKYTGAFVITDGCTIKAYATLNDYLNSAIATQTVTKVRGIGDALGKPDHAFATSGDVGWAEVSDVTATTGVSMRSGAIADEQTSVLSTTVTGSGTVSFKWKTSCEADTLHEWDHAEFAVDGKKIITNSDGTVMTNLLDGITDWIAVTQRVEGAGTHTLAWTYVKDDTDKEGDDCAWVSEFDWRSDFTSTQTTDIPVPYAWLDAKCLAAVNEYDAYENLAKSMAENGRNTVAECYVAGLDPESETAMFRALITLDANNEPIIAWNPTLEAEEAALRTYTTYGKPTVDASSDWQDLDTLTETDRKACRFFKVGVKMK